MQVRESDLESEIRSMEAAKQKLTQTLGAKKQELNALVQTRKNTSAKESVVSEHALLRYIERVKGVDILAITEEILTPFNRAVIKACPNCRIKSNEVDMIVKEGVVVSVVNVGSN
jgi:hypothetical protein